jgi:hypothetical protein
MLVGWRRKSVVFDENTFRSRQVWRKMIALRLVLCLLAAIAYKIATSPFVLAALLLLFDGWRLSVALLVAYTIGCIGAVVTAERHISPLTGLGIRSPPRGTPFWLFGNDQDGLWVYWYMARYPAWLQWFSPFMWTWWRNKLRNLPFVPWLAWLHRPRGELRTQEWRIGSVLFRLRTRGWMAELEYFTATRFGDFGPRLDQPDSWGAVSWAFRPWGRL